MSTEIKFDLLSEVIYNSQEENIKLEERLEQASEILDETIESSQEADAKFKEIEKFDYVYDNADLILEISKENEVILDAIAFAIGHENVTEGFVDGVKKGFKAIWEFLKKVVQSVKKIVFKVVDFIFGTTYGADYEKALAKAKETIDEVEKEIEPLKGKARVLAYFAKVKSKFTGNDKKAQEVVDALGDKPSVTELAVADKDGTLTPEDALTAGGIEPVVIDGEEKTTLEKLKEARNKFTSSVKNDAKQTGADIKNISDKSKKLITKFYDEVIKEASSSLVAKTGFNKGTLDQSGKLELMTKHDDIFEPLSKKERNSLNNPFVKTVTIGAQGADFVYLVKTKTGKFKTYTLHRPLNKNVKTSKLTFAMQVLYKRMNVKPPFVNKANAYQQLVELNASKKEMKNAKHWLDTLDVTSIEDIIAGYINENDDVQGEDFKELFDFYRHNKTIVLKAIKNYSSTKAKQVRLVKNVVKSMGDEQGKYLSETTERTIKLLNKLHLSKLIKSTGIIKVAKGKLLTEVGNGKIVQLEPKKNVGMIDKGLLVTISADSYSNHSNVFVDDKGIVYNVRGNDLVPMEESGKVVTTKGLVDKKSVSVKLYKVEFVPSKVIVANLNAGTKQPGVRAALRYEIDGDISIIKNFIAVIGNGAEELTAAILVHK